MKQKVAILGAGISGLSAAWYLQKHFKNDCQITIFEASDRVGGWIHTLEQEGALFECGPRSIRTTTVELADLIVELGLRDQICFCSNAAKKRYIAQNGTLQALPSSLLSLVGSTLGRKLLKSFLREPFISRSFLDDESVQSFFARRMGKGATDTFIGALTAGIYAANPSELSMRSAFPSFWQKEKQHGSLVKAALFAKSSAKGRSFSFKGGLSVLPKTLAAKLHASILLKTPVRGIVEENDKVIVQTKTSEAFDFLISTIQPATLSHLLPASDPLRELLDIPQTSLVTVSLAYREDLLQAKGFGFLCSLQEDPLLLGVVFDSSVFPEQNGPFQTRLSVMMGGSKAPHMVDFSNEALYAYAHSFVHKYLAIIDKPAFQFVVRAPSAISRYPVGHYRTIECLEKQKRRIQLIGSGLFGVSVGECVASAVKVLNFF